MEQAEIIDQRVFPPGRNECVRRHPQLADTLAATVLDRRLAQTRPGRCPSRRSTSASAGRMALKAPSSTLSASTEPVRRAGAERPFRTTLRHPAVERADEQRVGGDRAAQHLRVRPHRRDDPLAAVERRQPAEHARGPPQRTARTSSRRSRRPRSRSRPARPPPRPPPRRASPAGTDATARRYPSDSQPRARQSARKPACLPEQLCSTRVGADRIPARPRCGRREREQPPHRGDLLGPSEVRRAGDRDQLVVELGTRSHDRQRLDRLRRGAEEGDQLGIAGREDGLSSPSTTTAWTR